MRSLQLTTVGALLCALLAGPALAAARPPAKPVSAAFYTGKWYEIARTPNAGQRDCEAATTEFKAAPRRGDVARISDTGAFSVIQVCRKGAPSGPAKVFGAKGKIVIGSRNAKFSMSFLGGLKTQEYWVIERADDQSWAIMATPGGNYVWLLSRQAVMAPAERAAALARVSALGYAKLEFPKQPPA